MVLECWVIILILGIAGYMFIRSNKKKWAVGVLPLMLVPFLNIVYHPIGEHILRVRHDSFSANLIRLIIYLVSFAVVSCWVIIFSRGLPKGRSKYAYITSSLLFTAILIVIFIVKLTYI